jgi:16S rRNA processing protein RimM
LKKADLVLVGKVVRSQGKDGRLKVRFIEQPPPGLSRSKVHLRGGGRFEEYEVESLDLDRNSFFLKLRGVDTLAQADALTGREIFAEEGVFPGLEKGRYYTFQLIGSRVVTKDGAEVGTVAGVMPAGGSNLLVVARGEKELYVPFTDGICVKIDPEEREIVIDPPAGLLDLNEI